MIIQDVHSTVAIVVDMAGHGHQAIAPVLFGFVVLEFHVQGSGLAIRDFSTVLHHDPLFLLDWKMLVLEPILA